MDRTTKITTLATLALSLFVAVPAQAQFGRLLKAHAKEKVKQKAVDHAEHAVDKTIGNADAAVTCVVTDTQCMQKAEAAGTPVSVTDAKGRPVSSSDSARAMAAAGGTQPAAVGSVSTKPGEGAWANYDFIPGERPIFVDDFGADNVGDFPRRLEFGRGNMEVVEWKGARYLRATSEGTFEIPLPETLPERFTMEFDYAGGSRNSSCFFTVRFGDQPELAYASFWPITERGSKAGLVSRQGEIAMTEFALPPGVAVAQARIMVDGQYAKLYVGEHRVANVPNAKLGRSKAISITFCNTSVESPGLIGNIRVAAGGRKLYDALAAKGRVATHGILFATGSAEIEGESTPTLKEIGEMLAAHAELELTIEGHTDNTGSAAANQTLSEQRAAAVKQYLVAHYGVDAARLDAKGFGASKPVASNDTPEGRQQNRRVELVKR